MKHYVLAFILGIAAAALTHTASAFNQGEVRCSPKYCCDLVACCTNTPNSTCQYK